MLGHLKIVNMVYTQGVFFPAGVRVFLAGNLKNPQEILTKTLMIEQKSQSSAGSTKLNPEFLLHF